MSDRTGRLRRDETGNASRIALAIGAAAAVALGVLAVIWLFGGGPSEDEYAEALGSVARDAHDLAIEARRVNETWDSQQIEDVRTPDDTALMIATEAALDALRSRTTVLATDAGEIAVPGSVDPQFHPRIMGHLDVMVAAAGSMLVEFVVNDAGATERRLESLDAYEQAAASIVTDVAELTGELIVDTTASPTTTADSGGEPPPSSAPPGDDPTTTTGVPPTSEVTETTSVDDTSSTTEATTIPPPDPPGFSTVGAELSYPGGNAAWCNFEVTIQNSGLGDARDVTVEVLLVADGVNTRLVNRTSGPKTIPSGTRATYRSERATDGRNNVWRYAVKVYLAGELTFRDPVDNGDDTNVSFEQYACFP